MQQYETFDLYGDPRLIRADGDWVASEGANADAARAAAVVAPNIGAPVLPMLSFSSVDLRAPQGSPTAFMEDYGLYIAGAGGLLLVLALMGGRRR